MDVYHGRRPFVFRRARILRGFDNDEIIEILDVSLSWLKRWRPKVERDGLPALARKSGSGRLAERTPNQRDELKTMISQGAKAFGYVTDRWTSRIVADADFEDTHPDWFEFEYLPAYAPEWNPVEACWHRIKNGSLPNFVPTSDDELVTDVHAAAMKINEKQMITAWFKQEN